MTDYFGIRRRRTPTSLRERSREPEEFDWKIPINPLLNKSLEIGFTIPRELNYHNKEIDINKHISSSIPDEWISFSVIFRENIFLYDSKESYLLIIVHSFFRHARPRGLIRNLLRIAPILTKDKNITLWFIDDLNLLDERRIKINDTYLDAISEGLKHEFSLIISLQDMVIPLIDFLFNVITARALMVRILFQVQSIIVVNIQVVKHRLNSVKELYLKIMKRNTENCQNTIREENNPFFSTYILS